mmetsp:Transcript_13787/g.44971  ORF Transcript_13787/g.44971 Transcript_13787/m.44971 type:complete len:271 (+) Transcript_13787:1234-2046(+)
MGGGGRDEAVDDEAGDGDACAPEVRVEGERLRDGRRLGQRRDEDRGFGSHQFQGRRGRGRRVDLFVLRAVLIDIRLVRARVIQEHQGVPRRRRVHHDEPVLARADLGRERVEHRELLGAGRVELLAEQGLVGLVEGARLGALGSDGAFDVLLRRFRGVDRVHADVECLTPRKAVANGHGHVRGGVGGRDVNLTAAARERETDRRRQRRLPGAALAHEHHDARRPLGEAIHGRGQVVESERRGRVVIAAFTTAKRWLPICRRRRRRRSVPP